MTVATQLTSARADYTEVYQTWSATADATWQVKDLSGAPFNVPANAVVEVAIIAKTDALTWGGVRAVGSSLNRRFRVYGSADAWDVTVMHVQANASSQIEHYSETQGELDFMLIGYWDSGTYVETFDTFQSADNYTWQDYNLSTHGVSADQVAEIVIPNTSQNNGRRGGVRRDGSSLSRYVNIAASAKVNAVNTVTMFVRAGGTANATIETYAEVSLQIPFTLVGYWSTNPGSPSALSYSEKFASVDGPSSDATWEDIDLTSRGAPDDTVVELIVGNASTTDANNMGARENGSALGRLFNLRAAVDTGDDWGRMHVIADSGAIIERYHEDFSDGGHFQVIGYWGFAGVTVAESGGSTDAKEGCTTDSYTIVLESMPFATVTITADPDDQTDLGSGAGVAIELTFLTTNWDTPQTVTVTPVDDFVVEGSHTSTITHTASSSDGDYDGISIDNVVVNIEDNDPFTITNLGSLGTGDSFGYGINNNEYVAGCDEDPNDTESAWYWSGSSLSGLGTLGGDTSQGTDINDAGEVVGLAETHDGHIRAFFWDGGPLDDLGTLSNRADSEAYAVNESSEVVGTSLNVGSTPSKWLAFIYLPAPAYGLPAGMSSLGTLGGAGSVARDINESGLVVGGAQNSAGNMRPFLWLPADAYGLTAGMNDLGTLGGESRDIIHRAQAINADAQVVGLSYTAGGDAHAFIWLPSNAYGLSAGMNDLGVLTGGDTSWAFGINNDGRVVGTSNITGGDFHAFLWEDGTMYDLNDLVDPNDGWELLWATAVNEDGDITGWGTNGSGDTRALLLTQPCDAKASAPPPNPDAELDPQDELDLLTSTACGAGACGGGAVPFGMLGMGACIGLRAGRRAKRYWDTRELKHDPRQGDP